MLQNKTTPFFVLIIVASGFITWIAIWYSDNYAPLPYYSKQAYAETKSEIEANHVVPISTFAFPNHIGDTTTQEFIQSSVSVFNYFFTRCGNICPKMTHNLANIQKEFKENNHVKMVSFSCDPNYDKQPQLLEYASLYGVDPTQWVMLTGDKRKLYSFARQQLQLTAVEGTESKDDFIHSPYFVLIDKKGYIRGYYDGTDEKDIKQIINDIQKLL